MELNRTDAGTRTSLPTQGSATPARIGQGGFEAIISDRGVELSSIERTNTGSTPSPASEVAGAPRERSTIDAGVQASPAAAEVVTPPAAEKLSDVQPPPGGPPSVSTIYNQRGGRTQPIAAASSLGQKLDITG